MPQCAQLTPRLLTTPANRHDRLFGCQIFCRDRGGGGRSQCRNLDRVEEGEHLAIARVEECDDALNGGKTAALSIAGKIRVDLRDEHWSIANRMEKPRRF